MKLQVLIILLLSTTVSYSQALHINAQTVSDADSNIYNTVTIGTQIWMKENLKTTKYNDGTSIPNITDQTTWGNLTSPAFCWYDNNDTYKDPYGALYNWYTVNTGKLCPNGWHVPSEAEFATLSNYLGGGNDAGEKLKEKGTTHWMQCSTWDSGYSGGNNESGFTAVGSGYRTYSINFNGLKSGCNLWTTTESFEGGRFDGNPYYYYLDCSSFHFFPENSSGKGTGFSVRCINDNIASTVNKNQADNIVVYPNPASDKIWIKNYKLTNTFLTIYDIKGKEVLNSQIDSNAIDISNLSNGIYFISIFEPNKIITKKLIKYHLP